MWRSATAAMPRRVLSRQSLESSYRNRGAQHDKSQRDGKCQMCGFARTPSEMATVSSDLVCAQFQSAALRSCTMLR